MKKLIIMRGLPGSGKSTIAKQKIEEFRNDFYWRDYVYRSGIFTTDDYWIRPDDTYDFNEKLLRKAHDWNFERFKGFLEYDPGEEYNQYFAALAILDNTNIKRKDFVRYVDFAASHGYEVEELTVMEWDVDVCFARNKHGVPREAIKRMKDTFEP